MWSKKIKCYDCGQYVYDLKLHRGSCTNNSKKRHHGTVECYTWHQQVADLKSHKSTCGKRSNPIIKPNNSVSLNALPTANTQTTDYYQLLDVSSSMNGTRLLNAKTTLIENVKLMNKNDRISIVTFDTNAYFKLKPRPVGQILRQNELPKTLDRIYARGATAIWDAIWLTVTQIQNKNNKTIIHVLTDGEDNSSSHTYQQILNLISEYPNISLSIIHINNTLAKNNYYNELCQKTKGDYVVIAETEIIITMKTIFKKYYC